MVIALLYRGKVSNVEAPANPRHCGDNSPAAGTINELLHRTLVRLFPGYPSRWGRGYK